MVVKPPALLPGDGLLFSSTPLRPRYSSHHRTRGHQFFSHFPVYHPLDQQLLGPIDLGRFAENYGAAVADHQVAGVSQGRVGRDARQGVRPAALETHHQVFDRNRPACNLVGFGQHGLDRFDTLFNGAAGAAGILDVHALEKGITAEVHIGGQIIKLVDFTTMTDDHDAGEVGMMGPAG